ncbi:MAG: DUF4905 domain-containing protein [Ignavibacteriae bacterium]|nr:DUF4905 domain-containing protein [Ignavibacteriota bacterium]
MSFLKIFKQAKLDYSWKYETNGVLWRLLPTTNHLFVGEDRNLETKQVTFFCLDARNGKVLWNNLSFTEPWWMSIESVSNNILFLHEFATPDMPDHKKIYAIQIDTAQILWMNDELQFHFADGQHVYGSKSGFESRQYFRLDSSNGTVLEEVSALEFQQLQTKTFGPTATEITFLQEVEDVETLKKNYQKLPSKILKNPQPMEWCERNGRLLLSYYSPVQEKGNSNMSLQQHIIIADREGRLLYQDIVNEQLRIPLPDSVMEMHGIVYYIKNKKCLIAVRAIE